ncbi:hypothetical protein [Methanoregula boonei]|jgi:hypothetical protein|nr:hypothetical protein [Methanoregula boonei]
MVGTKTGDCVVVGVASGEEEEAACRVGCALAVIEVVGIVVGGTVAGVPFTESAAVPAAAVVAKGTVVEEAVVTVVVTEEMDVAFVVAVGTGALAIDPTIADTGIATAKARTRVHNRIRFNEKCGVIREHWMPGDMRIMERGLQIPSSTDEVSG